MGEHYGSVHVLGADVSDVSAALAAVAEELDARFFVAPSNSRWTSAYPSHHGQDDRVGAAIARRLPHHVIQLQVHDGDIFLYQYYHKGTAVDAYCSNPDYFGERPPEEHEQLRGRPERLTPLLVEGAAAVASLRAILHPSSDDTASRDGRIPDALAAITRARAEGRAPSRAELASLVATATEAATRMERVASLLGITGASGAYEYIQDGESPAPGYAKRKLTHIPDLAAERTAARSIGANVRAELKQLRADGRLLVDATTKGAPGAFPPRPVWITDDEAGYLLAWGVGGRPGTAMVERVAAPWAESTPLFAVPGTVVALALHASSELVAVGHASGEWSVEVYEAATGARRFRAPIARATDGLAFSPDGRLLVVQSDGEVALIDVASGDRAATVPLQGAGNRLIVRPGGDVALAYDQGVGLHVIDLHHAVPAGAIEFPTTVGVVDWVHALAFTENGEHLCISTPGRLAVYSWSALVASGRLTEPERAVTSVGDPHTVLAYGIVHDASRGEIVYGGMAGELRSLSLTSEEDRLLRVIPGRPAIGALGRSADRSTLAITTMPDMLERQRKPPHFQVWSYDRLWS